MRGLVSWLRQIYLTLAIFNNSVGTTTVKVANNDPAYTNHQPFERVKRHQHAVLVHQQASAHVDPVVSTRTMLWIYTKIKYVIYLCTAK